MDVEGAHGQEELNARLVEFRQNNAALQKQLEDQRKRFEGIDPDDVRKLADEKRRLEEERQIKSGEVEKVLENRIKGLKADWDKQLGTLTAERDALTTRLTAIQIDQGAVAAATKRGLRPTAIADLTARARGIFKLVNGAPRAFETDGQTIRYGKDGVTPMTFDEWTETLASEAPHLFETNSGSGAAGSGSGSVNDGGKNPWRKPTWNLTEQMKIQRADPRRAEQLKVAAGC